MVLVYCICFKKIFDFHSYITLTDTPSEAAGTGLQFLLPPAPSDRPAHSPGVLIPDNWNKLPAAHPV